MNTFAKLFETIHGQLLVMLRTDGATEDSPCITFTMQPEGLGLCETKIAFVDTDHGYDAAEKAFENMNEEAAIEGVRPLLDLLERVNETVEDE